MNKKKYNLTRGIKTNDEIEYKAKRLREERQEKYANISHVYRKGIIELYKKEFGED